MNATVVLRSSILLTTLFLLSNSPLQAQSNLSLSSGTAVPGGTASLSLSLSSPASIQPAAIQWALSYPAASVSNLSVTPGPALSSAGKTITCGGGAGALTCVAWGLNSAAISDGVIATVSVTLSGGSTVPIGISNGLGASSTGAIAVTGSGGTVTVGGGGPPVTVINSISCTPGTLGPLSSSVCRVALSGTGGGTVSLSSNSANLSVPASLTIPSNSASGVFLANTNAFSADQTVTVTGTLNSSTTSTTLSLVASTTPPAPPTMSAVAAIACNPGTVAPLSSSTCTVTLSGSGGGTVALSTTSTNLSVPASLTIPSGSTSGIFSATANAFAADQTVTVTATMNSSSKATTLSLVVGLTISGITATGITASGATITWTTNKASDSQVAYGVTTAYESVSPLDPSLAISHTVNLTGLAMYTTYHFKVVSHDSQNKVTESGDFTFTTLPLFQLHSDVSEVSGLTNGSIVTPAAAPPGFSGTVVVNPGGSVNFAPAQSGDGVYFQQCCGNTANAYYKFSGTAVGSIFNVSQGQISFYLKSRQSYAQRVASGTSYRQVLDVRDATTHLFGFITQASSGGLIFRFLVGANSANNPATYYFVPAGTEEALFGNGVTLKVTLTWNANVATIFLNDAMVKKFTYTTPTPNWSAASNFDLGAYEYLTNGGYNVCDDIIDEFTVSGPAISQAPSMPSSLMTSPAELETSIRPLITRLQNGADAGALPACSPEAVATLIGQFLPGDAVPASDRSGRATSLAGARVLINGSYAPILFASPAQVEFLCPAVPPATALSIAVETASGLSNLLETRVEEASPGIFATGGSAEGPDRILPGATVSIRATGMNWLARFPTTRLFVRIGERSVAVESNTPDLETPGVSKLTVTLPADVSGDSVPVVLEVVQADGASISSNSASIPIDTRLRAGSDPPSGR